MNILINIVAFLAFFVLFICVGYNLIVQKVKPIYSVTVMYIMIGLFLLSSALYMAFLGAAAIIARVAIADNLWLWLGVGAALIVICAMFFVRKKR